MSDAPHDPASQAADGLVEAVLVPPVGLVPVVLGVLLVVAAWAVLDPAEVRSPARPDLTLSTWQEGAVALNHRRDSDEARGGPGSQAPHVARDLGLWLALEATRGAAALAQDTSAKRLLGQLEERVRQVGLTGGAGAVERAATAWARQVRRGFEADLSAAQAAGGDVETWFARKQGHVERLAPGLSTALLRSGITAWWREGRLAPAAALVVEAVAEQRYLALGRRLPPPRPALSTPLATLLLRYRVEAHAGLDLRRRLQLAEELSARDPAWPRVYATGVLMARAGRYRAARAWFLRAVEVGEQPQRARLNARWCRRQQRLQRRAEP